MTAARPDTNNISAAPPDSCSGSIDRNAPAGSKNSLGAKSDCNGRPDTDDGIVEAKDEMPPIPAPLNPQRNQGTQPK
jgi:hypothetical protein